jgi:hypothetical protein
MNRTLDRTTFATLSISDKIRAYLLLRSTPTHRETLMAVSQASEIAAHLVKDLKERRVRRPRLGWYILTPKGRRYYADQFPPGLLGVRLKRKGT